MKGCLTVIGGGFLILVANGAGNYSLDNRKK